MGSETNPALAGAAPAAHTEDRVAVAAVAMLSTHSLAALVGFVKQRGQLQQELKGTVHILSEILTKTKPGTQLTSTPPPVPTCSIRKGFWDREHFPMQARHHQSHLVPLGILLEFHQHLGHLKDTGHRVT